MLSAHEVNKVIENKKREKVATYETITTICQKLIVKYAKHEKYRCFFAVPEFILGTPIYNLNAAIIYLMNKLSKNGYLVKYYFPNYLYISWSHDEISGKKISFTTPLKQISAPRAPTSMQTIQNSHTTVLPRQIPIFPPKPLATRNVNKPDQGVIMPHIPTYDIRPPQSTFGRNDTDNQFIKSISDYKPSGKFVLDLS
jgi:Family of unknown function (DUF5759)